MIVVNKKFKVIVITLLIVLEVASTYLMYRSFNNRNVVLDNVKLKGTNKSNGLAIMIEKEDGTYQESSNNAWPEEMLYNEEKSGCIDSNGKKIENSLTYEGGIATIKSNTTSYCYLYFDLIKDDITIAISTDGESGAMPSSGAYSATCSSGNITWNQMYQRIEMDSVGTMPLKCNVTFTKDNSEKQKLTEVVMAAIPDNNYNGHGYRYSGIYPNNYIWFNNEMWRIISVEEGSTLGQDSGVYYTKIIRNDTLGTYNMYSPYNDSNNIYQLLNTHFYSTTESGLNAISHAGCSNSNGVNNAFCDFTHIGILSTSYYGKMIVNATWRTGYSSTASGGFSSAGVTASSSYQKEILVNNLKGHVGLLTLSDYGYASSSSYHSTAIYSFTGAAASDNWVQGHGNEWTLTQYTSNSTYSQYMIYIAGIGNAATETGIGSIRPVVYLDSNVFVIDGTGTEADPYVIGM